MLGRVAKRLLLWDWTNTAGPDPRSINRVAFGGDHLFSSVSNWNAWVPPELNGRAPFRPMVRTKGQLSGDDWTFVQDTNEKIIHFFNEPERQCPDGKCMTPMEAVGIWEEKMVPLKKKGKKLVSPSCSNDPAGQAWIEKFMREVQTKPDYLGLHYYGTEGDQAIEFFNSMHNKFPKYPVIVSEIASTHRDIKEVFKFTARTVNWMDKTDWIFEYGFFGCMRQVANDHVSPAAQLMNSDGSFTELMRKLMYEQPMKP